MSPFCVTLKSLLDLEGLDQLSLAKRCRFSQSKISRYLSGAIIPARSDLVRLVTCISSDRDRRLALLLSFLSEEAAACHPTAGFDDRHYKIVATVEPATGSLGADLELLAEQAALHDDVRDLLADLAILLRRSEASASHLLVYQQAEDADLKVADDPPKV